MIRTKRLLADRHTAPALPKQFGQRIGHALAVEFGNGIMDGLFERGGVGEGLVGEVIGFEIVPDRLDIIGVTW